MVNCVKCGHATDISNMLSIPKYDEYLCLICVADFIKEVGQALD